jgi:hypothetical protein
MNTVGIDKDGISLAEARQLKEQIMKEQQCQVVLYQTRRGFHLILVFKGDIPDADNFKMRERYGDCPERMRRSRLRGEMPGVPIDILFSIKKTSEGTFSRRRVW